jgi:hypothetical protein
MGSMHAKMRKISCGAASREWCLLGGAASETASLKNVQRICISAANAEESTYYAYRVLLQLSAR